MNNRLDDRPDASNPNKLNEDMELGGTALQRPSGSAAGLGATPGVSDFVESLLSQGLKGRALTEAVIAAGLARNPQALRAAYQRNKSEIDEYLDQIDTTALVADTQGQHQNAASGAALGFAGGAALSLLIQSLNR